MDTDVKSKRASFITRSTEIRETFGFASPVQVIQAVKVYTCDFYGAMLWDLGSDQVQQLFRCWYTCVKLAWIVPRACHTYLVDNLLSAGLSSVKEDIMLRYLKFFRGLLSSPCREVVLMANLSARDVRTTVGKNLMYLREESSLDSWSVSPSDLRAAVHERKASIPVEDRWRLRYLARLLQERGQLNYDCKDRELHTSLINSLCVH